MSVSIVKHIEKLLHKEGISQAELARAIKTPRQLLSSVIKGNREMSLQLAMKLEAFFSLPDGSLYRLQATEAVFARKNQLRNDICNKLMAVNAFWSYDIKSFDDIPDEEIIEKCFRMLDIDDIDLMFELYSRKKIRRVWKERMAIQGDYLMRLNVMIAMYYFGIKQPERYLARVEREHIKKISKDAANVYRTL